MKSFFLLNQIYEIRHWQFWTFKMPSNLDYDQSIIPPSKFRTSQENNEWPFTNSMEIKLVEVNIF